MDVLFQNFCHNKLEITVSILLILFDRLSEVYRFYNIALKNTVPDTNEKVV